MITLKTQAAIAVLNDIYTGEGTARTDECKLSEEEKYSLLYKLATAGIIRLVDMEKPQDIQSYGPNRKSIDVSLLDILEATGEHLNCNHPTTEIFYSKYGNAAKKLGIVNQITRTYLQEIKLFDL
ncbi:hypothetical protein [Bacteroides sp.]|uniref:hypothetical protein n=1 Tax=Bacteroides sp. TaxID=29523 RepID=UPI00261F54DA|nr:hypothetical protein [Bacteroides sp.]